MSMSHFPDGVPTETELQGLLAIRREVKTDGLAGNNGWTCAVYSEGNIDQVLPSHYHDHLKEFFWREASISLVLTFRKELSIPQELQNTVAKVLKFMNIVYMCLKRDAKRVQVVSHTPEWRSTTFDRCIEYWVKRHEPFLVREFRRKNKVVVNQHIKGLGEYSFGLVVNRY